MAHLQENQYICIMKEIWKEIELCDGYEASSLGRIKNIKTGRVLKPYISKKGYVRYCINQKVYRAHQLIAMAFLNHQPNGMKVVVDHIDGDKTNNTIENLQLTSQRNNASKDRYKKRKLPVGVYRSKTKAIRYQARIWFDGKQINLGSFDTIKEAENAYNNKLKTL